MRLGTWITVPHPSLVDLLSNQDFEWLCVDMEHSPVSLLDLQTAVAIIQGKGKKAFVRVNENAHLSIKFPLDAGVDGIIIPMVNSFDEAKSAVECCLYPPAGRRGVGLARAQGFGFGFESHLKKNLNELEIFLQIEHYKAVERIDEIVSLDKVTGVFLGPYDLSGSMGIPGQFEHPRMLEAIEAVATAVKKKGKLLGAHVIAPDHKEVNRYEQKGYNFVAFSLDTLFLGKKIKDELEQLRNRGQ